MGTTKKRKKRNTKVTRRAKGAGRPAEFESKQKPVLISLRENEVDEMKKNVLLINAELEKAGIVNRLNNTDLMRFAIKHLNNLTSRNMFTAEQIYKIITDQ